MSPTISFNSDANSNSERSSRAAVKHIAIVVYDGISLLGAGTLVEALNVANELQASVEGTCLTYKVSFLSEGGGMITCSASISTTVSQHITR